jgi:sec-independent protein translocase protein TatA
MGAFSPWHILIVVVLALLLFGGGGKISSLMGDFAKGIKSFRKGLQEEDKAIEDRADKTSEAAPNAKDSAH